MGSTVEGAPAGADRGRHPANPVGSSVHTGAGFWLRWVVANGVAEMVGLGGAAAVAVSVAPALDGGWGAVLVRLLR